MAFSSFRLKSLSRLASHSLKIKSVPLKKNSPAGFLAFSARAFSVLLFPVFLGSFSPAHATPPSSAPATFVCVEAVWCSIAAQIGGPLIKPDALLRTEGLDPHHLQATPSMARRLAQGQGAIVNGATYDDWALSLAPAGRFVAADLAGWKEGDDPHLFFSPQVVSRVAKEIASWLETRYPARKNEISLRLDGVEHQVAQVESRLDALKARFPKAPVAVLEPAGARLLEAAGLDIADPRWARMTMEGNGGSPRETAALAQALDRKEVRFLVVNPSLDSSSLSAMAARAVKAGVPIVKIGESLPAGLDWAQWMNGLIDQITLALKASEKPASPPLPSLRLP